MATRRAALASDGQIGAKAYTLSGQGLVSRIEGAEGPVLSAPRTRTPLTVRKPTCMASAIVRSYAAAPEARVQVLVVKEDRVFAARVVLTQARLP